MLFPDLHWGIYLTVTLIVGGSAYQTWLSMTADERVVNNYPATLDKPPLRVTPVKPEGQE